MIWSWSRTWGVASVLYTTAASASPSWTFETTWRTLSSFETVLASTLDLKSGPYVESAAALSSIWAVYWPIGTLGWAVTNLTPSLARSATDVICLGLSFGA